MQTIDTDSVCLSAPYDITFNIPGSGPFLISPSSSLPFIRCSTTIDGYTQPGSSQNTDPNGFDANVKIAVDGAGSFGGCGFSFSTAGGRLRGLVVENFNYGGSGAGVCGQFTQVSGNILAGNATGVHAPDNSLVGGSAPADRNLIAANVNDGIFIAYGGNAAFQNNMITGNRTGISVECGNNLTLRGNIIQGNTDNGVLVGGSNNLQIDQNRIEVNGPASGTPDLGNGILLKDGGCGPVNNIQVFDNKISGNRANGVRIVGTGANTNNISSNSIHSNALKNIDLDSPGGPRPNDPGDSTPGPNAGQNYPDSLALLHSGGNTIVSFTLDSPSASFRIEAFENLSAGQPAGQFFIPTVFPTFSTGTTPTSGAITIPGLRDHISLTVTKISTGNTSEFSLMANAPPEPDVDVSTNMMDFGDVTLGNTSASQTATLTSTGAGAYRINAINSDPTCEGAPACSAGDFSCSTDCKTGVDYPADSQCSITGAFSPKSTGFATTTIYVCDNTSSSPQAIQLKGNGVAPPVGAPEISPSRFDFGRVLVGSRSQSAQFSIINHENTEMTLGSIVVNGTSFRLTSTTCGSTLPPVSACYAFVDFGPVQPGAAAGSLEASSIVTFTPSLGKATRSATAKADLSGTGFSSAELVLPTAIDLGSFTLGATEPLVKTVKLTNTGNAVLTFAGVSVSGPFTLVNNCPLNLAPGDSCSLNIEFRTTTVGDFSGTLNISSNATGGARAIPIIAHSQRVAAPVIQVTPQSIGFGSQLIGSISPAQRITVTNEGGAVAALGTITASPDFVLVTSTCGLTLEPGSTCFADVAMRPLGFGQRSGQVVVPSNATGSPNVVNMVGTGCRPFAFGANRFGSGFSCSP